MKLRKMIACILTLTVILGTFGAAETSAAEIGDVVNHVLYTDIVTYINGTPIESFNIDGYTVLIVEDLRNYGFNVVYDNSTRRLTVTMGSGEITSAYTPSANTHPVGEVAMDVLYTDIVTYIKGRKVDSYNIQGRTVCYVDDLADAFADIGYRYDNSTRTLSMEFRKPTPAAPSGSTSSGSTSGGYTAPKTEIGSVVWVSQLSNKQIAYDDEKNAFRLQFSLLDSNRKEVAAAAEVDIRIVNDKNETVYTGKKTVSTSDFSTWTRTFTGAQYYLATVYIKDSEIAPGTSSRGTVYFTVHSTGYFLFPETSVTVSDNLPVKTVSILLPSLPQEVCYFGYRGALYSACKVTDIKYEISDDDVYFYFSIEKTYDEEGPKKSGRCEVGWKLYDYDDYVVASGTFLSDAIRVGEKVKGGKEYAWDCVSPGGAYRLEIMDVEF